MPKYAVDFLAEIQELNSATNFDDFSENSDLLTNLHLFNVPVERPSEENNVVDTLMGNAQCCFKRYPGYQAHRHVVVSRGVQCSEATIKNIIENHVDYSGYLSQNHFIERGETLNDRFHKEIRSSDNDSIVPLKASVDSFKHVEIFKRKPEVFTPITQEPPELRDSSKFFRRPFCNDYVKNRRYYEDDIDSLSATISNYSLHEKLIKMEDNDNCNKHNEPLNQNSYKFSNNFNFNPICQPRQSDFKTNIKDSLIRSGTGKSRILTEGPNEMPENQSSDSNSSFGNIKDNKSMFVSNSGDITPDTNGEENEKRKCNDNVNKQNLNNERLSRTNQIPNSNFIQAFLQQSNQSGKPKSISNSLDKGFNDNSICASERINKSTAATVTFMKGSEELKKYEQPKSSESDNLNALRKKQKFLMKHSRMGKNTSLISNEDIPPISLLNSFQQNQNERTDNPANICQLTPEYSPHSIDNQVPKSPTRNNFPYSINYDSKKTKKTARNSSLSDKVCVTPNENNKIKRTVSFDRCKSNKITNAKETNQSCSRNTVRAKYCTMKVIKHKFYVPESANIEQILRDPSDRRIKAICDRHNCDIEIYSKVPKCGFLKNIIILAAPNTENLRKCVRSLDYSMHWCLTPQLA